MSDYFLVVFVLVALGLALLSYAGFVVFAVAKGWEGVLGW